MQDNQLPKPSKPVKGDQLANAESVGNSGGVVASQNPGPSSTSNPSPSPSSDSSLTQPSGQVQIKPQNTPTDLPLPKPTPSSSTSSDLGVDRQSQQSQQPQQSQQSNPGQHTAQQSEELEQPPASTLRSVGQKPPANLTALSSMASNQLPQGAVVAPQPEGRPEIQDNPNLRAQAPVSPQSAPIAAATPQVQAPRPQASAQVPSPPAGMPPASGPPASPAPSSPATTATGVGGSQGQSQPKVAQPKKSWTRFLPFIVVGLVVVALIGVVASRFLGRNQSGTIVVEPGDGGSQSGRQVVSGSPVELEYWGLWEPSQVLEEVIADFQDQNPNITVRYIQQSHRDYRERLQTAIASGNGPDIFRFHASWTPMLSQELSALPASVITANELTTNYYPVVSKQLQVNGQPVGVPLMYEGLALLYNKDIFDTAGLEPPQTWAELRTTANRLTVKSGGAVQRAGVALGNSTNVDHFSDILALLMLQNGADPTKPNSAFTKDALRFYANFVKEDGVWSDKLPNSTVAFARGEVAMIFAPSWRIHEIIEMNPNLKFGVTTVPKLAEERLSWASYWAEGVSSFSDNQQEAGMFLKYISSPEVLEKLYSNASEIRSFGEIYPRLDMADKLAADEYVSAYLQDAPYAQGWYLSSDTHDNGINDMIIKYYEDAVTALVSGSGDIDDVVVPIELGTNQVLRQYGVSTTTSTTTGR